MPPAEISVDLGKLLLAAKVHLPQTALPLATATRRLHYGRDSMVRAAQGGQLPSAALPALTELLDEVQLLMAQTAENIARAADALLYIVEMYTESDDSAAVEVRAAYTEKLANVEAQRVVTNDELPYPERVSLAFDHTDWPRPVFPDPVLRR